MSSEAAVTSLSATRHYGTEVLDIYDEIEDLGRPFKERIDDDIVTEKVSTFVNVHLALLIRMQMIWYIHTGDSLSKSARIPFDLYSNFTEHDFDTENLWLYSQLYESQEEYV